MNKINYTNYTTGSGGGLDYMQLLETGLDIYSKYKQPTTTSTQQTSQTSTQPTTVNITPQIQGYTPPEKSTITWNVSGGAGTPEPNEKKDNTFMFIGIGIAILVISAIAFLIIKKKGI